MKFILLFVATFSFSYSYSTGQRFESSGRFRTESGVAQARFNDGFGQTFMQQQRFMAQPSQFQQQQQQQVQQQSFIPNIPQNFVQTQQQLIAQQRFMPQQRFSPAFGTRPLLPSIPFLGSNGGSQGSQDPSLVGGGNGDSEPIVDPLPPVLPPVLTGTSNGNGHGNYYPQTEHIPLPPLPEVPLEPIVPINTYPSKPYYPSQPVAPVVPAYPAYPSAGAYRTPVRQAVNFAQERIVKQREDVVVPEVFPVQEQIVQEKVVEEVEVREEAVKGGAVKVKAGIKSPMAVRKVLETEEIGFD